MPDTAVPPYVPHHIVLAWSQAYVTAGLSVIPILHDGTKAPASHLLPFYSPDPDMPERRSWIPFQHRLPTTDELEVWYYRGALPFGVGVVCGRVSGGLEVIDVDATELIQSWLDQVRDAAPGLLDRLVLVQTPRPGLHAFYRCPTVGPSQKLASGMVADEGGAVLIKALIETKGEGGYATTFPSPPDCHKLKKMYEYMTPRTLLEVATIEEGEREVLLTISKSFNRIPVRPPASRPNSDSETSSHPKGNRPGDIFNARANWEELLEQHGWVFVGDGSDGITNWRRPGKSSGTSASLNYASRHRLYVFSSNAAPLEQGKSYSQFEFVAAMNHAGDFAAAAAALSAAGYCQPSLPYGARTVDPNAPRYFDRGAAYRRTTRRR